MKTIIFNASLLLLVVSCSSNEPQSVSEETEYGNFVSAVTAELSKANMSAKQRYILYEQAYKESGLQALILASLLDGAKQPRLDEMQKFYNDVILGKYAEHVSHEQLKLEFIKHAVRSLDLTKSQEKDFFIKLTRDLIALNAVAKPDLAYKCLSLSKELFGKNEFNEMVKKSKFHVRYSLERMQEAVAAQKDSYPKDVIEGINREIRICEKIVSDLDALKVK